MNEKPMMEILAHERSVIETQILALTNQLKGLDIAISFVEKQEPQFYQPIRIKPPRCKNVKETILEIVQNSGVEGITARSLVNEAKNSMSKHLDRGSVSSFLSRLKKEGTLSLHVDTGCYFIPTSKAIQ